METIYLDHAATTFPDAEIISLVGDLLATLPGNPSSIYAWGHAAKRTLEEARTATAQVMNARPSEIVFTGSGTEGNNLALRGIIAGARKQYHLERPHLIVTAVEHHAVFDTAADLAAHYNARLTILPPDREGRVSPEQLAAALVKETVLVSVMYVNNEIGTVEPVAEIGELLKRVNEERSAKKLPRVFFHSDAVQAAPYFSLNVDELGVDALTLSGHKFYAPKGVGALYVRSGTPFLSTMTGGGQEGNRRSGTENVVYAAAFSKALAAAQSRRHTETKRLAALRDRLLSRLSTIPGSMVTGSVKHRAPHIASFAFDGVEAEVLLIHLDEAGVAASSGSACTTGKLESSHVLAALKLPTSHRGGSLRLSLGRKTTEKEIDRAIAVITETVATVRKLQRSR